MTLCDRPGRDREQRLPAGHSHYHEEAPFPAAPERRISIAHPQAHVFNSSTEFITIEGTGRMPRIERPDAFIAAITHVREGQRDV